MFGGDPFIMENKIRLKNGDVREDGKVFWGYSKSAKDGEYWMEPEKFSSRRAKVLAAAKAKYATPEGKARILEKAKERYKSLCSTPEGRAQILEKSRNRYALPEVKAKILAAAKEKYTIPEVRAKILERAKAYVPKPESKERRTAYKKEYRSKLENKEAANNRHRNRMLTDPLYALSKRLRRRTDNAFSGKGFKKNSKTAEMLGCSWEDLLARMETLFKPGMSWDNRSEWHIDHIIPIASAKTEDELRRLCHWTNLQPLWWYDNLKKGANYQEQKIA
jgi:hypothetical protein